MPWNMDVFEIGTMMVIFASLAFFLLFWGGRRCKPGSHDRNHEKGEEMASYTTGRHKFARGPVTDEIKVKLLQMIKASSGKEELLAEDIIEAIAVARNDPEGFRAANRLLEQLQAAYTD